MVEKNQVLKECRLNEQKNSHTRDSAFVSKHCVRLLHGRNQMFKKN